jgi:hypothetical protein
VLYGHAVVLQFDKEVLTTKDGLKASGEFEGFLMIPLQ